MCINMALLLQDQLVYSLTGSQECQREFIIDSLTGKLIYIGSQTATTQSQYTVRWSLTCLCWKYGVRVNVTVLSDSILGSCAYNMNGYFLLAKVKGRERVWL